MLNPDNLPPMKTKFTNLRMAAFLGLAISALIAIGFVSPASAQTTAAAVSTAVVAAPVAVAKASAFVTFITAPTTLGWLFATVAAIYGVFQKNAAAAAGAKATTTGLMLRATIVGVEHATALPQVQAVEQDVKGAIQKFAVANGVESDLSDLVKNITGQMAFATPAPAVATPPAAT